MAKKTVFVLRKKVDPSNNFYCSTTTTVSPSPTSEDVERFRLHVAEELAKAVPLIVEPDGYTVSVEEVEVAAAMPAFVPRGPAPRTIMTPPVPGPSLPPGVSFPTLNKNAG